MKKYLIYRKRIEINDKNNLWCASNCPQKSHILDWSICDLNDEKLVPIADGKQLPETFLRTGNCLEREEK